MVGDCVFCKIINKELGSEVYYEDDELVVIKNIHPQAPVHLLVIPKEHIASVNELDESHGGLIAKIVLTAKEQALEIGVADSGYKLIWNVGKHGGQTISHLHLHLLGGKQLSE